MDIHIPLTEEDTAVVHLTDEDVAVLAEVFEDSIRMLALGYLQIHPRKLEMLQKAVRLRDRIWPKTEEQFRDSLVRLTDDQLLVVSRSPRPFNPHFNEAAALNDELHRRGL